jgi:hypothetical protein
MRATTLACAVGLLLFSGCASVNTRLYDPSRVSTVDAWALEFAYEEGSVEQLQKSSGDSELKVSGPGTLRETSS